MSKMKKLICIGLCVCMLAGVAALPASCATDNVCAAEKASERVPFDLGGLIGWLMKALQDRAGRGNGQADLPAAVEREESAENKKTENKVETEVKNEDTEKTDGENAADVYEREVARLVNAERAKYGLPALTYSSALAAGAKEKSADMAKNGYFSHTSPTYGSPFDRMKSRGISYRAAGENIAMGYRTPEAVVQAWMDSPGHRANILSGKFTEIGVGYVAEGNYWTQWFRG